MQQRRAIGIALTGFVGLFALICAGVASAQSRDIVILNIEQSDLGAAEAATDDAGTSHDADADAVVRDAGDATVESTIPIDRIREDVPEASRPKLSAPGNDRKAIVEQLARHVKRCIATRTRDPSDADTRFHYLVRGGFPNATLTTVVNAEPMYLDPLHVSVLRSIGETRAIDVRAEQKMFRECVEVVGLSPTPHATERVSFLVRAGALKLLVRDVQWSDL